MRLYEQLTATTSKCSLKACTTASIFVQSQSQGAVAFYSVHAATSEGGVISNSVPSNGLARFASKREQIGRGTRLTGLQNDPLFLLTIYITLQEASQLQFLG